MTAKSAGQRRPGRPGGPGNVREQILDAAEAKFADQGFAGASLRDIVEQANVTQALVTYYFGSKHQLFVEVYMRRGQALADARMAALGALRARTDGIDVAAILHAFFAPGFDLRRSDGGRDFLRLQARLHTEPMEFAYEIRRKIYDESTKSYAAFLTGYLPHLTAKTVYWRFVQIIGAYLYLISDAHRAEEISEGLIDVQDEDAMLRQLVAMGAAALLGPEG